METRRPPNTDHGCEADLAWHKTYVRDPKNPNAPRLIASVFEELEELRKRALHSCSLSGWGLVAELSQAEAKCSALRARLLEMGVGVTSPQSARVTEDARTTTKEG